MSTLRRQFLLCSLSTACLAMGAQAQAQTQAPAWPSKPITLVVGWPAGGDTDAAARIYAEQLSIALRQPVVVDNRPGASGTIAASAVARAVPDGHTLFYTSSTFTLAQHVLKVSPALAHDVQKDFTPIVKDQNIPLVLVAPASAGIRSVAQLVQKARGQALPYGSPGAGTPMHIVAEMLHQAAGIQLNHVPYRGSAPMVADLLGGHVAVGWATPGVVAGHIKNGTLLPLAVAQAQRSSLLPDVPTLAELGYPSVKLGAWQGMLGPKGLPAPIVTAVNDVINQAMKLPEVRAKLAAMNTEPVGGAPAVLAAQIEADTQLYQRLVPALGLRSE